MNAQIRPWCSKAKMTESEHFSEKELRCKCGCGRSDMDVSFLARLETLRHEINKPIILTSAYRCPKYNDKVSTTGQAGPHTRGRAVDVAVFGADAFKIVKLAMLFGFTGIGIKQKGNSRFVHLDDLQDPRPRIWSY